MARPLRRRLARAPMRGRRSHRRQYRTGAGKKIAVGGLSTCHALITTWTVPLLVRPSGVFWSVLTGVSVMRRGAERAADRMRSQRCSWPQTTRFTPDPESEQRERVGVLHRGRRRFSCSGVPSRPRSDACTPRSSRSCAPVTAQKRVQFRASAFGRHRSSRARRSCRRPECRCRRC